MNDEPRAGGSDHEAMPGDTGIAGSPARPGSDHDHPAAATGFPWPPPPDGPVVARLRETWRDAMFAPTQFYRRLPRSGGTAAAVTYYLVVGVLVAGVNLFWATLAMSAGGDATAPATARGLHPLTRFLLSPPALLLALGLAASVTHFLLLVLQGARHGFGTTVRTMCYAYSPMGLAVIPFLGPLVGAAWMVAVSIIGLREAHDTATWKPAVAVLLPCALGLVIVAMVSAAANILG